MPSVVPAVLEFGFAFVVDLCTERHLGYILSNLCADFRRILQTANVLYLPANGHCAGHATGDWVQLRRKEYGRVKQIFRTVLVMTAAIMVVGTVLCLVIPGQLIGLFTENAATVAAGKTALRIISGGFIVSAVSVTASGALEGLGKGTPSLVISLCRYLVIIVPVAFLLSRVLGAQVCGMPFGLPSCLPPASLWRCTTKPCRSKTDYK